MRESWSKMMSKLPYVGSPEVGNVVAPLGRPLLRKGEVDRGCCGGGGRSGVVPEPVALRAVRAALRAPHGGAFILVGPPRGAAFRIAVPVPTLTAPEVGPRIWSQHRMPSTNQHTPTTGDQLHHSTRRVRGGKELETAWKMMSKLPHRGS